MPIQLNIKIRETKEGVRYQVRSPNAPNATPVEIAVASTLLNRLNECIETLMAPKEDSADE